MARIALRYKGRLLDLSQIAPLVERKITNETIGITRKFLILAAVEYKKCENLDCAKRGAMEILLDGYAPAMKRLVRSGVKRGLQKLGVTSDEDLKKILDKTWTALIKVLEVLISPRTRAEARQLLNTLVDDAEVTVEIP